MPTISCPGPVARAVWDHPPPQTRDRAWWSGATFHPLPPAAHLAGRSQANPVVVPGLPPWTGAQPLFQRERAWVREPILNLSPNERVSITPSTKLSLTNKIPNKESRQPEPMMSGALEPDDDYFQKSQWP